MNGTRLWLGALGLLWIALLAGGAVFVARALTAEAPSHFYSEEQARSGVIAYAQHCATCHGLDLAGTAAAPPLVGDSFWASWGGRPVADLYGYIASKMPLGRGGSLRQETYLEATALILWTNRLPTSEYALTPNTQAILAENAQVERPAEIAPAVPMREALLGPWIAAVVGQAPPEDPEAGAVEDAPQTPPEEDAPASSREDAVQEREAQGERAQVEGEPVQGEPVEREPVEREPVEDLAAVQEDGAADEPAGPVPDAAGPVEGAGDVRLSVFPARARVTISAVGPGGEVSRDVDGGTRVVAGLAPGDYRIRAVLDGLALEQLVTVRADEVLEVEMRFPEADVLPTDQAPALPLDEGDEIAGVVLDGERLYLDNCLYCHGPQGGGIYGIALADNPRLDEARWPIRRVLLGGLGMPSFHRTLVPAEIAAVVSYVRTSFGNEYGEVGVQQVLDVREELQPELPSVLGASLEDAPLGQRRYTQLCSACHGLEGGGDVGPPLANNPALRNEQLVITRILFGGGIMPSYAHHPDIEIAAIASYIRTAWTNDFPPISAEQVEVYRPDDALEGASDARTGTEDAQDAQ